MALRPFHAGGRHRAKLGSKQAQNKAGGSPKKECLVLTWRASDVSLHWELLGNLLE